VVELLANQPQEDVPTGQQHAQWRQPAPCKTVGSAYVGSNPSPATTGKYSSGTLWRPWAVCSLGSRMPSEAAACRWSWDIRGMASAVWRSSGLVVPGVTSVSGPCSGKIPRPDCMWRPW